MCASVTSCGESVGPTPLKLLRSTALSTSQPIRHRSHPRHCFCTSQLHPVHIPLETPHAAVGRALSRDGRLLLVHLRRRADHGGHGEPEVCAKHVAADVGAHKPQQQSHACMETEPSHEYVTRAGSWTQLVRTPTLAHPGSDVLGRVGGGGQTHIDIVPPASATSSSRMSSNCLFAA